MKNIAAMTTDLSKLYEEIRAGSIDLKLAAELNNTAGKMLKAHQLQLAYHALRGEAPNIDFLAAESVMPKVTHALKFEKAPAKKAKNVEATGSAA